MTGVEWFAVVVFLALDMALVTHVRARQGERARLAYELVSCPVNVVVCGAILWRGVPWWGALLVFVYMWTQFWGMSHAALKLMPEDDTEVFDARSTRKVEDFEGLPPKEVEEP